MRHTSVYCLECLCGRWIEAESSTLDCPACSRTLAIEWAAPQDTDPLEKKPQEGGKSESVEPVSTD